MARLPDFNVNIKGFDKLQATLSHIPNAMQRKVLRQAGSRAIRPINLDAKRNARKQKRSGLLAKSIGTKVKAYKTTGTVIAMSGPRVNFRDTKTGEWPVKIAHLVEFGTKPHEVKPKDKKILSASKDKYFKAGPAPDKDAFFGPYPVTVSASPKPFMEPAWDKNKNLAADIFRQQIESGLNRVARELAGPIL